MTDNSRLEARKNIKRLLKSNNDFKKKYNPSSTADSRSSEYSESYVEWPLSKTMSSINQKSSGVPFPLFYEPSTDSKENSQSVYKTSYIAQPSGDLDHFNILPSPAGVPYNRTAGESPTFFAWPSTNEQNQSTEDSYAPEEYQQSIFNQPLQDTSTSEYSSLYKWPAQQIDSLHMPSPKKQPSTISIGDVDDKTRPSSWQSEYGQRYTSPEKQRQELSTSQLITQMKRMNQVLAHMNNQPESTTTAESDHQYDDAVPQTPYVSGHSNGDYTKHDFSSSSSSTQQPHNNIISEAQLDEDDSESSSSSLPIAGVKSIPRDSTPNFYAWPIHFIDPSRQEENDKSPTYVSEYDTNFHPWPSQSEEIHELEIKVLQKNTFDSITSVTAPQANATPSTWVSEYDAEFQKGATARRNKKNKKVMMKTNQQASATPSLTTASESIAANGSAIVTINDSQPDKAAATGASTAIIETPLPKVNYNEARSEFTDSYKWLKSTSADSTSGTSALVPTSVSSTSRLSLNHHINGEESAETTSPLPRFKNNGHHKLTDTLGTTATVTAEKNISNTNSSNDVTEKVLFRSAKKSRPKVYQRADGGTNSSTGVSGSSSSTTGDVLNLKEDKRVKQKAAAATSMAVTEPSSSSTATATGVDNLTETQSQYRWPQSTTATTSSDKENNAHLSNTASSSSSSFAADSLNSDRKLSSAAGTLGIGVIKKAPSRSSATVDVTPVKRSNRPLQYTDSASSVRVPTPTSQQPVGMRSSTSVKKSHQTPSSHRPGSKSMSGAGGLFFPGGNMEYTPTGGRHSNKQPYASNKSSSPGGSGSVNGQDDFTASIYSTAAAAGPNNITTGGGYQMYDPILINKRYPMESERQMGRWTSESRNSYGGSGVNKTKKSGSSPNKM